MPIPSRLSFPNRRWFSLNRTDFERLTAENRVPSVLLFEGEEEYLKQSALAALRKKLLPEGLEDLNETVLEAPETDAVIAAAETMPFLADRRIVLLRDYPALTGRSEADDRLIRQQPFCWFTACRNRTDGKSCIRPSKSWKAW